MINASVYFAFLGKLLLIIYTSTPYGAGISEKLISTK